MKINFDTYIKENKQKFTRLRLLSNPKRLPRRRPRDPEEEFILILMAYRRWKKEIDEGRLLEKSPKRYIILK